VRRAVQALWAARPPERRGQRSDRCLLVAAMSQVLPLGTRDSTALTLRKK